MTRKRKSTVFEFETITAEEARARRSRKGSRRSKYSPIGDQFSSLGTGEVLAFQASKNEVQGVRNYMRRNFEAQHKVNSRRVDDEHFEVHLTRTGDA